MTQPGKKKVYNIAELSARHQALIQDHNRMAVHVTHLTNAVNTMADQIHELMTKLAEAGVIQYTDPLLENPEGTVGQPVEEGAEGLTSVPADDIPVPEEQP